MIHYLEPTGRFLLSEIQFISDINEDRYGNKSYSILLKGKPDPISITWLGSDQGEHSDFRRKQRHRMLVEAFENYHQLNQCPGRA